MTQATAASIGDGNAAPQPRQLHTLRTALKAQARTLHALILREARVRHGRSRIGYAWAVVEPFAVVAIMLLFFNAADRAAGSSLAFPVFFASGILPFQFFRHSSTFLGQALEANAPLFNYPTVREFDAVLARLVLEAATHLIIIVLVFSFLMLVLGAEPPADVTMMIAAFAGLALLSLGIGLNIAVLQRRLTMTHYIYNMIMAPSFFVSGIFFSLESVPPDYRAFLTWNPIIHGVETFRVGYYASYADQYVSLSYLYMFGLVALFVGMIQLRLSRRGMR